MEKDNLYRFDQYLRNELSEDDKKQLENELSANPLLKSEFENHKALIAGIKYNKRLSELKKIQEVQKQFLKNKKSNTEATKIINITSRKIFLIAASIVLLVGVFAWWNSLRPKFNDKLFVKYDSISELKLNSNLALINEGLLHRGIIDSDDFHELKKNGLMAFDKKEWDKSIDLLTKYIQNSKVSDEETSDEINLMNLYIARSYLEKSETNNAIVFFKKADKGINDFDNYKLLQELIRWQLTLAYLKNNDLENALNTAILLKDSEHTKIKQEAINLIKDIE